MLDLSYLPNGEDFFARLRRLPGAAWLDGGGRGWDVFAARPRATLTSRGGVTEIRSGGGCQRSRTNPLTLLRRELGPRRRHGLGLPFVGGAIGYFSYDLGRRLNGLSAGGDWPEMAVGIYDWAVLTDHTAERSYLVGGGPEVAEELLALPPLEPGELTVTGEVEQVPDQAGYGPAFRRVMDYLRAGDCYQVNLARRLRVSCRGDAWAAYRAFRERSPAPFAAYLTYPFGEVLSLSPERFLALRDGEVETRPIKGTRRRSPDPLADRAAAEALRESRKDRAENLMIVDLLRNDLGRVCQPGSIHVPELFAVESFPQVHHLVSSVRGSLREGGDALDLLQACLPGGSITGAPKRRAMEIIEELEAGPRGVYCGSIGYIGFDGAMDSNIAIRTAVHREGTLEYWAGGGLVADSECGAEYQETLDKAAFFLDVVERLRGA